MFGVVLSDHGTIPDFPVPGFLTAVESLYWEKQVPGSALLLVLALIHFHIVLCPLWGNKMFQNGHIDILAPWSLPSFGESIRCELLSSLAYYLRNRRTFCRNTGLAATNPPPAMFAPMAALYFCTTHIHLAVPNARNIDLSGKFFASCKRSIRKWLAW